MTRQSTRLDPKDIGDTDVVTFDFTAMLNTGESLALAPITSEVYAGTDASPASLLSGAPQIQGLMVLQTITAGVVGVEYLLRCSATTSAGRVLVQSALINVIRI